MNSTNVLVVYATTHGHTRMIADEIASVLRRGGVGAEPLGVDEISDSELERYDAAIVGASVHGGKHQRQMIEWVAKHAGWLAERPSSFFSVSLSAAEDTEEAKEAVAFYLHDFAEETGWTTPTGAKTFAGALRYREYDPFTRLMMRLIMRRGGHPTDSSHDYDYTDWPAVDAYATEFAQRLTAAPA